MQNNFYQLFGWDMLCKCGHTAKKKTTLNIHGSPGLFTLPEDKEYCPECFAKQVIRCAWCGNYILPGNAITLHSPKPQFETPEYRHRI